MPLIPADYPDPDVIRVGDRYYMITTTMHMFPGGDLLTSPDLVHWQLCSHVYTSPVSTPERRLENGSIYGKGMWAATLRYHRGIFHVLFVCNDTHSSVHCTAACPEGPWETHKISGFYHDCSLLFDGDTPYLAYGNREIRITQMNKALTGPEAGGIDYIAVRDQGSDKVMLGYEGSHLYKIGGRYYLFFIHWPRTAPARRTQACFTAESITGPWRGGDILCDDHGFYNQGIAQGGIVDTPDGKWYMILFQDRFAAGRMPVLCSFEWENGFPARVKPLDAESELPVLFPDDPLTGNEIGICWQWNHLPDRSRFSISPGGLCLRSSCARDAEHAVNTLTMRTYSPVCACSVTLDASALCPGDRAGLIALQGCYAALFAQKTENGCRLVMEAKTADDKCPGTEAPADICTEDLAGPAEIRLTALFDYRSRRDTVRFFVTSGGRFRPVGPKHALVYRLDHFMGCRAGLCCYSKEESGPYGQAVFRDFIWIRDPELLDILSTL